MSTEDFSLESDPNTSKTDTEPTTPQETSYVSGGMVDTAIQLGGVIIEEESLPHGELRQ